MCFRILQLNTFFVKFFEFDKDNNIDKLINVRVYVLRLSHHHAVIIIVLPYQIELTPVHNRNRLHSRLGQRMTVGGGAHNSTTPPIFSSSITTDWCRVVTTNHFIIEVRFADNRWRIM